MQAFMAHIATSQSADISLSLEKIIRALFINLCAFSLPRVTSLLNPFKWFTTSINTNIDLQDAIAVKRISLRLTSSRLILTPTQVNKNQLMDHLFPVFCSASMRANDPIAQQAATEFVNNIVISHRDDLFLWSDGSFRRHHKNATFATLVSHQNIILSSQSCKLQTTNISTAEICGIIANLNWLQNN